MRQLPIPVLVIAAAVTAAVAHAAQAAPQIAAAVPTGGAVELVCAEGRCAAELSTICLQQDRATPRPGTAYRVHDRDRDAVAVTGHLPDGGRVALAPGVLDVTALRAQVAFRVSVPQSLLERQGLVRVSVEVTRLAMLAPVAEAGDPEPQTPADVARAEREAGTTGAAWVLLNSEKMAQARLTRRIINRLPRRGTVARGTADRLWQRAAAAEKELRGDALGWTRRAVDYCRDDAENPGAFPMRRCLGLAHDRYMHDLNVRYWDAAKPQS